MRHTDTHLYWMWAWIPAEECLKWETHAHALTPTHTHTLTVAHTHTHTNLPTCLYLLSSFEICVADFWREMITTKMICSIFQRWYKCLVFTLVSVSPSLKGWEWAIHEGEVRKEHSSLHFVLVCRVDSPFYSVFLYDFEVLGLLVACTLRRR